MLRRTLLSACVIIAIILSGCATTSSVIDDSKLGTVASRLGMTSQQAQAGLGSMLTLAEHRLQLADFQKISKWIPRAEEYMALGEGLGAFQGTVRNAEELSSAFATLGISAQQAAGFVTEVTDYLGQAGGPQVAGLMSGALK